MGLEDISIQGDLISPLSICADKIEGSRERERERQRERERERERKRERGVGGGGS